MPNQIVPVTQLLEACAQNIEQQLASASNAFLEIGSSLYEAKEALTTKEEFTLWWENNTTLNSQRTVQAYMQVAQRFAGKSITSKVGYSVLQELVSASDEVVEKAEKRAEERSLTVKEARAMARPPITIDNNVSSEEDTTEEEEEEIVPNYANGYSTGADERAVLTDEEKIDAKFASPEPEPEHVPATAEQTLTCIEVEEEVLQLPEADRIEQAKSGLVTLGFSDMSENLPSRYTVMRVLGTLEEAYPHMSEKLAEAGEEVSELY